VDMISCLRCERGRQVPGMKPIRSFDERSAPVDNVREKLVAICNTLRVNIYVGHRSGRCGGERKVNGLDMNQARHVTCDGDMKSLKWNGASMV
jgi:hypothetical protein